MKIYPRVRRVFLRKGDGASSFDLKSITFTLSDGTFVNINISYNSWKDKAWDDGKTFKWKLKPIKRNWYVSVASYHNSLRWRKISIVSDFTLTTKHQVRRIIARVAAGKNKLVGIRIKKRKPFLSKWLRDS